MMHADAHAPGMHVARVRWGIVGLLAFESLLALYLFFSFGFGQFVAMAGIAACALAYALVRLDKVGRVEVLPLAVLAVVTLWRAAAQTPGADLLRVAPSFAVAVGFSLLAWDARTPTATPLGRAGIVLVALSRSWFALSFLLASNLTLGLANVMGAAGAWLWVFATPPTRAEPEPAAAAP